MKTAIITGAAKGIGKAIESTSGGIAIGLKLDVIDPESALQVAREVFYCSKAVLPLSRRKGYLLIQKDHLR